MHRIWTWLKDETNRKTLGFVGVACASLVAGGWTLFVYLDESNAWIGNVEPTEATAPDPQDVRMTRVLIGEWEGTHVHEGVPWRVRYTLTSDGEMEWIGEPPHLRLVLRGSWRVEDGTFVAEIAESNNPNLVPAGTTTRSEIGRLTSDEFAYVETFSGRQVVDRRIR